MPLAVKAESVFDGVRALMNDSDGNLYTDEVILPYFKLGYDGLRQDFEESSIPFSNITSENITIPAGVTSIGNPNEAGSPALPTDLVEIYEMYERTAGTNQDYMLMRRRNFLPKTTVQTEFLEVFTWQKQIVRFLGATSDIEVKIDYIADSLREVVDGNTLITPFNCQTFLKYRTAALCSVFIGENETRGSILNQEADNARTILLNIGTKFQQSMPVRRRPFRANWKNRGWGGGWGGYR